MAQNKVMKLWSTIVTAFLALCTALGLITTTAAAAVPQAESVRNTSAHSTAPTAMAMAPWAWSNSRALPPTMKQRIRAEAHGSSPSCRHRPTEDDGTDADATEIDLETGAETAAEAAAEAVEPLQH